MAPLLAVGLVALLLLWVVVSGRRRRRALLKRFRSEWGRVSTQERDVAAVALYHRTMQAGATGDGLDERTATDLDLDAVFEILDRTETNIGQQLLDQRLRSSFTRDELSAFESLMTRVSAVETERQRIQFSLTRLRGHSGDLWWLALPGVLEPKRWDVVFPLLTPVVPLALALATVWPPAVGIVILGLLTNMTLRYVHAPRLGPLLRPFRQLGPLLATATALQPMVTGDLSPLGPTLTDDVSSQQRLRRMVRWVSHDPMLSDDFTNGLFEATNLMLLLDVSVLYFAAKEVRAHGPALLRTIATVGTVDAAISIASYRAGTSGWTRPVLESSAQLALRDLRHPLLDAPVPNSLTLVAPAGVLVTGSNMSGKSTFLRTLGVNAVLAQTLNTCLASAYEAPVFTIRSVIGRGDDLASGTSYYKDEVDAVLAVVRLCEDQRPQLFLFDELFRGTSTTERIAAAEAVLRELLERPEQADCAPPGARVVIAATHDRELVRLLDGQYAPYHFTDTVGSDGLSFDYRLREGPAVSRNAVALLEAYGAPARVVRRARARQADLDGAGTQ